MINLTIRAFTLAAVFMTVGVYGGSDANAQTTKSVRWHLEREHLGVTRGL